MRDGSDMKSVDVGSLSIINYGCVVSFSDKVNGKDQQKD